MDLGSTEITLGQPSVESLRRLERQTSPSLGGPGTRGLFPGVPEDPLPVISPRGSQVLYQLPLLSTQLRWSGWHGPEVSSLGVPYHAGLHLCKTKPKGADL